MAFKLKSGNKSPFKSMGSSPAKQKIDPPPAVTWDQYRANTDTLKAYQYQHIGEPDPIHYQFSNKPGLELAILRHIEEKYGKDSDKYKNYKTTNRAPGTFADWQAANDKLEGHPISFEEWERARNVYLNARIKEEE